MTFRIALSSLALLGLAHASSTTVTFACGHDFGFTVTFLGRGAANAKLSTSSGETYRLRRSRETGGRRFANKPGNVILIIRDMQSANLTRGDTMVTGCSGTVPTSLLKTMKAGPL